MFGIDIQIIATVVPDLLAGALDSPLDPPTRDNDLLISQLGGKQQNPATLSA